MSFACLAQAQDINFSFQELNEKDGLTPSDEYYLSTDKKGFVWIGSENGLLRFDGKEIIKFQQDPNTESSLFENRITSKCFEDKSGNLWFSSFGAINCYLRNSNTFLNYSIDEDIKDYYLFHSANDTLWLRIGLGEEGYLYYFNTTSKNFTKKIKLPGSKCVIIPNEKGKPEKGLSISLPTGPGMDLVDLITGESNHVDFLKNADGRISGFPSPTKAGYIDEEGIVWIGVYNGIGKYEFGHTEGIVYTYRAKSIDKNLGWIYDIAGLKEDLLLLAADKGLFVFDKKKHEFVQQFKKSTADNYPIELKGVNNINLDSAGNLWLSGTDQKIGFANINKHRFPQLKNTAGISFINITEDHEGNMWCSSIDSGTFVFTAEKELIYHTKNIRNALSPSGYNPLPEIYYFLKDNLNQWWGNIGNYFFLWDKDTNEFEIDIRNFFGVSNEDFDRINQCLTLNNGKTIVTRGKTILEIKVSEGKIDTTPWFSLENFELNIIKNIYEDQHGNVFLNDDYGTLLVFQVQNNYLTLITKKLNFGIINSFQEDPKRNKIWVAGTMGLGSFDAQSMTYLPHEDNDRLNAENVIYDIVLDDMHDLWLPSSMGVYRLDPDKQEVHCFNTADGLLSSVFNKNSSARSTKTGEIWVGGKNGINVFNPSNIQLLDNKPKTQITNLLVNDEPFSHEGNISQSEKLTFPFSQNTLSFHFTSLDYADPSANEFMHQMVGLDEAPVPNSTRGFTRYGNIPAGNYTFKVWATNSDLVLNETPLELQISITPPFYQTWWFYLLCLLAISAIIYGVFQYRIAQILKVERLRTRIASDLHDDVGGILSGLAMKTEIMELTAKEEEKDVLRQIADMSRSAMSGMRDTVWAIDSRKDKFEDLLDRIREHAEEVLIPKDIRYTIDSHDLELSMALPPLIRQNLYLIFKESITNIAKHSNGDNVLVDLKMDKNRFELRIHDNGTFEEKSYKSSGLGLSNMKMRAKKLDGNLTIDTEAGYEVTLNFPSF